MQHLHARNVIIGAGAMGAATAYHLARRGVPVVLLEQFALGHDRGSSHGAARSVALQVALARALGGSDTQVFENCPVRRIDLETDPPTVLTDTHQIAADRLIVTAGAWTRPLLPGLSVPLRPTRQQVLYVRP